MSDAELAFAFSGLCAKALNTDPDDAGAPIWRELLSALSRPRLVALAGAAGASLPPANWPTRPAAERARALAALCDAAGTMREHFSRLEQADPPRHARDSLRRIREEIPWLRDHGMRGFLHRVAAQFRPAGAEDELRPYFESAAELAAVLGAERPRAWRPNPVPDWAGWCDEWARLADFCRSLTAAPVLGSEPPPAPAVGPRAGEGAQPGSARPKRHPHQPSPDRRNDILAAISAEGVPLTRAELIDAMALKTEGKLGHHLAWMVQNGLLINVTGRGYWPAGRPVPE